MKRWCAKIGWFVAAGLVVPAVLSTPARAQQPRYRLQADAYGRAEPGVALLSLQGEGDSEWVSAEALVWGGLRQDLYYDDLEGDVLVIAVRLHDPGRRGQLKLGRFIEGAGALRPVHMDGASGWLRLPLGLRLETYGGVPVTPRFEDREYDWLVGGRLSRAIGDWGSVGFAYQHRRERGSISNHKVGLDLGAMLTEWLDANAAVAYDLTNPGVSEARAALSARYRSWRFEAFGMHRSPSRLLPSTSLFTVLGDVASRRVGGSVDWDAAPRLDLDATASARILDGDVGESLELGGVLLLDDEGRSSLRVEGRREGLPSGDWTGVRLAGRFAAWEQISFATELELIVPDDSQGRGDVWPWGLAGVTWAPAPAWKVAGAVQASSSPQYASRVDGIVRLTRRWEGP